MEVHHHSHTASGGAGKKWIHYFWEFLMLFLAVLCGFLAEYQLEHVIEHNRAKEYAEMLKDDLKKDTAQLNTLILGKAQISEGQKNAERLHKIPINKVTWGDVELLSNPGLDITPFTRNDAAYSQMISSGNLRLLKDKELIRKLGLYESFIKGLDFWENGKKQFLQSDYGFRAEVNEEIFLNANPDINYNKPLKSLGFDFSVWAENNLISKRLFYYELTLREFYPELKKIADEIIGLLNREYHLK